MHLFSNLLFVLLGYGVKASVFDNKYSRILACRRDPTLEICDQNKTRKERDQPILELVTPPPMPKVIPQRDVVRINEDDLEILDQELNEHKKAEETLKEKCIRVAPIVRENCHPKKITKANKDRCASYFKDCSVFLPKTDPLSAIANSFNSGVNINVATVDVNGIPYYPINEEGGIGVTHQLGAPFGSWGGGYNDHVGVRDYWSQHQEVGANWYDGKYGYKNGWSVPLVQSLGVEGGQHNTVSVPLHGKDAGKVMVDNGYGVGGYYGHNDHVGVDWKKGDVVHNFGVGVPFARTGFNTGQAVTFPGPDVWARALGRK